MQSKPIVSVIVPIYNVAQYLEQAAHSVLEQTFADFELILVEDGSPDESGQIIDRLAAEDDRIIPVHKPNGGVSSARNAGLELARGKYAAFLDGDDWYHPDFLEKMVHAAESTGGQIVSCAFEAVGTDHPPMVKLLPAQVVGREEAMQLLMGYNSFNGYVWNKLFHMDVIRKNNIRFLPDYPACEDAFFVGSVLYYCTAVQVLEDVLHCYRQVSGGANRGRYSGKTTYNPKWMTVFDMSEYFMEQYSDPAVKAACFLHEVREAGIVLRSMEAAQYHGPEYTRLMKILRRGALQFLRDENSSRSQKLSVLLSCVSPKLELAVWKAMNR